jgi:hypothetical protein
MDKKKLKYHLFPIFNCILFLGNTPTPPPPLSQVEQQQRQLRTSSPNDENVMRPRNEWPFRIYFNNLDKPKKYVDNKVGQQELKKELMSELK